MEHWKFEGPLPTSPVLSFPEDMGSCDDDRNPRILVLTTQSISKVIGTI